MRQLFDLLLGLVVSVSHRHTFFAALLVITEQPLEWGKDIDGLRKASSVVEFQGLESRDRPRIARIIRVSFVQFESFVVAPCDCRPRWWEERTAGNNLAGRLAIRASRSVAQHEGCATDY